MNDLADEQTVQLLSSIAAGLDPRTGEKFEATHVLRRKEVTKALNEALKALGAEAAKRPRRPISKSSYFHNDTFNRLGAKTRKELAARVLQLPVTYPLEASNPRVVRTEHARSQEPWKFTEQELLARVLPHTNDLKFLSIVFQRSENGIEKEARRLMAERSELREALEAKAQGMAPVPKELPKKAYSVSSIREQYPSAYQAWSPEDDDRLELLYCEGHTRKVMAVEFGRQPSAIGARIKKLELKEKYGK